MGKTKAIFSIGHSNHTWKEFLELLKSHQIECLVDVRSYPRSKFNPHFSRDHFQSQLQGEGSKLIYRWLQALGGMRKATKEVSSNTALRGSQRLYADYMQTKEFRQALDWLEECASRMRTVYMCAEASPLNCHRQILSDALALEHWDVGHIQSDGVLKPHQLTPHAQLRTARFVYPGPPELPLEF